MASMIVPGTPSPVHSVGKISAKWPLTAAAARSGGTRPA